ncbi:MAG TPA: type II toxin-antitoxin system RelE/ParE family toxin [Longimicrobium sp.]|nr:type II toxin-antitoxin system RelE/ParE family toxin [Longimicrobium sp.]
MIPITLVEAAKRDVARAAAYYDGQRAGLGAEFLTEVDRLLGLVAAHPELGVPFHGKRKLILHRFPYIILYRIEPDGILVLVVGHQRRGPKFWQRRG